VRRARPVYSTFSKILGAVAVCRLIFAYQFCDVMDISSIILLPFLYRLS
jgi:hypothetical protein